MAWQRSINEDEYQYDRKGEKLWTYLLQLLNRRPYSTYELRIRCQRQGYCEALVEKKIKKLIALNLVDDEDLAKSFVEELWRKKKSAQAIHQKLAARGLPLVELKSEFECEVVRYWILKLRNDGIDGPVIFQRLCRRGFSLSLVRQVWNEEYKESIWEKI